MKLIQEHEKHQNIYNLGYRFNPEDEVFYTSKPKKFKHPEGYNEWKVEEIDPNKYLNQRLKELGVKDKENNFNLLDKDDHKADMPIFTANKHGDIEILQYSLKRKAYIYEKSTTSAGTRFEYRVQRRLNPIYAIFCDGKYDFSEAKNTPFWHPDLIEAFENETEIETLVITEGQFKAWKATKEGIPTIGLTSISHFRDKRTQELHTEIIEFIHTCKVKKVVILWDGDCKNISSTSLREKKELTTRPSLFFKFAQTIRESLYKFCSPKKLEVFFATIKTEDIDKEPKGIDDLLIVKSIPKKKIVLDFQRIGSMPGYYIDWINITREPGVKNLRIWFKLDYVGSFYEFHKKQIKEQKFLFYGNTFRIEKGTPVMEISADLKEYKLIGTDFYRLTDCTVPTGKKGNTLQEVRLIPWKPDIIKLNHGKDALRKIEVFKGFTNIPSHIEYKQVINNEWNLYVNVHHEKGEGDFPTIKRHLKHVFQEHYDNEMILDYITILYKNPMQKLPVICLLSKEQGTGKSTFLFLLKLIFKQNMSIISNTDITGEFNAYWTSKLIAACEETIFDKKDAYEKIKAYTTQKSIVRNEKNKSQNEIPCMLHFVLCSNHENDFMRISKYDRRLWVRKVETFKNKNDDADITFDDRLEDEIPAFVKFIENREIKYKERGELFFHQTDFQTTAFKNLVLNSESAVVKEIKEAMIDSFLKYGGETREVTAKDLKQYFGIANRFEDTYLNKVLEQEFNAVRIAGSKDSKSKVKRYSFFVDSMTDPGAPQKISNVGRPYVLERSLFVQEEIEEERVKQLSIED